MYVYVYASEKEREKETERKGESVRGGVDDDRERQPEIISP